MNEHFSDVDPFGHGDATIRVAPVLGEEFEEISDIVKQGWGERATTIHRPVHEGGIWSKNFIVSTDREGLFVKKSLCQTAEEQDLITGLVSHFRNCNVSVAAVLETTDERSYHIEDGHVYSAYEFIDGEHFDGSQMELQQVAYGVADIHKALASCVHMNSPFSGRGGHLDELADDWREVLDVLRQSDEQSSFHEYVLSVLDEIHNVAEQLFAIPVPNLPVQAVYKDLHPHNVLFDKKTRALLAFIDFEFIENDQRRIRDVGFAMHRFSRTCGLQTERMQDCGAPIAHRCRLFLDWYMEKNELLDEEIDLLVPVLQNECLRKILRHLDNHYVQNSNDWDEGLPKHVSLFREVQDLDI